MRISTANAAFLWKVRKSPLQEEVRNLEDSPLPPYLSSAVLLQDSDVSVEKHCMQKEAECQEAFRGERWSIWVGPRRVIDFMSQVGKKEADFGLRLAFWGDEMALLRNSEEGQGQRALASEFVCICDPLTSLPRILRRKQPTPTFLAHVLEHSLDV